MKVGRTDMAAELLQGLDEDMTRENGLIVQKNEIDCCSLLTVEVTNERGAALLGKSVGKYFTLTLPDSLPSLWRDCIDPLAGCIRSLLPYRFGCVLIAALGNPNITPDALGPLTAESILVTRHLKHDDPAFSSFGSVALCRTGVLGTGGIESAAHIRALVSLIRPSLVIAVDALACRELDGLCKSVQISSTGIAPGSGVGNDRECLNDATLGVPVISIGVPTVADLSPSSSLFVTPRDIDVQVRTTAKLIAYALNLTLHPALTVQELESLL